jgi:tetraacyldisaccharide 4'-kinase
MNRERIERIWYGGESAPIWMRMLVPVYRVLSVLAQLPYRIGLRQPERLSVPVIVVGNLTAGGTGKTPLVIALVDALRERGFHPGVVSRGYGGSAPKPMLLDDRPDPAIVGDEPSLIRRRTRVPVAVGRIRVQAARLLLECGVDVILADDGLQNLSLARDIEICVIDGQRRFGNERLLPAGPLREPLGRLRRIAFRVCNAGPPGKDEIAMALRGGIAVGIRDSIASRALSTFAGQRVHGLAGIGNPQRFFASLRAHGIDVIEHAFPDHHALASQDLRFAEDLPVLMTEKDAVKCESFATAAHWCVPVRAELPDAFFDEIAKRLGRN